MKRAGFFMIGALILFAVPVLFQNCAEPIPEGGDISSLAENAPFAYEHKLDHIAYMSCSNMPSGYDTNTYFTFKAGAYRADSGIKLNSSYVYHVRNVTVADKARVLAESPTNKDVYISFGVRLASNLQSGYRSDASFVGSLSQPAVANVLSAANGTALSSNFPALAANPQLEDTVHYTQNEAGFAQPIRDAINSGAYIASTYNKVGADTLNTLGPSSSLTQAYGIGFKANFNTLGFGLSSSFVAGPIRVMTNLREYNLTTGAQTTSIWDCKPEWAFMIIRPTDDVNTLCPGYNLDSAPLAGQLEMYLALRQLLPPTTWGVNLNRRCLVPKLASAGQCYGSSAATINYSGGICDPVAGTCPHYLSICKRR